MPYRRTPLVSGEYYHVFNRSIDRISIFNTTRDYQRAYETIWYYRYNKLPLSLSHYKRLDREKKFSYLSVLKHSPILVDIIAYCIMPNHIHFLLRQKHDLGISTFLKHFQQSYSKYYNKKNNRTGSLFQAKFKAVRIETDEQLLHDSRYIHLNPVTSYIIPINDLIAYQWSSFKDYMTNDPTSIVTIAPIMNFFQSKESYKDFVYSQADYQRQLHKISTIISHIQ
jgi:putative transposase